MRFDDLQEILEQLKHVDAPGLRAHERIFPEISSFRKKALERDPNPRLSAVASIFFPVQEDAHILLIERQTYEGIHSGQIGFPGGKMEESDKDLEYTARRETQEEVGITMDRLEMIRSISDVYIPPSGFLVKPFLFKLPEAPEIIPDPREVQSVLRMPVSALLNERTLVSGKVSASAGQRIETKYFDYGEKKIWGATAMMLSELKLLLQQSRK